MDISRTIKRLGAKNVTVIYRRSRDEMLAEEKEIECAEKEKIEFLYQTNILKILGDTKVEKIECIKTELVEKEGDTRKYPVNIEGSNFELDMDYVIMAVGSEPEKDLVNSLGLELTEKDNIKVNENYQTSNPKVYAGGDITGTKSTVAWAARTGRDVAEVICNKYIQKNQYI